MAGFKRATLKDKGLTEEQIDFILGESNRMLAADYVPKTEIQAQIDAELQKAPKPITPTESEEYKKLAAELGMTKALASDDFTGVKPKFRESVYKMLDHADKHKPYAEQLTEISGKYEEYFTQQAPPPPAEPPKTPQFGTNTQGQIPGGKLQPAFNDVWGFGQKK